MFAYCLNNPVSYADPSGNVPFDIYAVSIDNTSGVHIIDQRADPYASKKLGGYTVSYNGCGAIASYNALIDLGCPKSFQEVLDYYNACWDRTFFDGIFGVLPHQVAQYFEYLGYTTEISLTPESIDTNSYIADACILFYMFPRYETLPIVGTVALPGAHYVEYSLKGDIFVAYNTGTTAGIGLFHSPSNYGYRDNRFYAVGIFIFGDKE